MHTHGCPQRLNPYGHCECDKLAAMEHTEQLRRYNEAAPVVERVNKLESENAQLRAENDELRKDKERLDLYVRLRESSSRNVPDFDNERWYIPYLVNNDGGAGGGVGLETFSSFRAAIDQARANEQKENE